MIRLDFERKNDVGDSNLLVNTRYSLIANYNVFLAVITGYFTLKHVTAFLRDYLSCYLDSW